MRKKNQFIIIYLIILVICVLCSCAQVVPEVRGANCSLIVDFLSETSEPEIKLSVFAQAESEVRRFESITIKSNTSDYSWNISDVIKLKENKRTYVGYNNLAMPDKIHFPTGSYTVCFKTLNDDETEVSVNLNYEASVYRLKSKDVGDFIKNKAYRHKYSIYSEDGVLLFYGQLSGENSTLEKIKNNYPAAEYYREVYIAPNNGITFLMPKMNFQEE